MLDVQFPFCMYNITYLSGLHLSNSLLERSVKQQAHYFSQLETEFSKFSRIESRIEFLDLPVNVKLLLSGTVMKAPTSDCVNAYES